MIPLGQGNDHLAYETEAGFIRRFPRRPDPAGLAREARLLAAVARHCPLPVPQARVDGDHLAYPKLPGACLLDRPDLATPRLVATFAEALRALQAIPLPEIECCADLDDEPLPSWLGEAAAHHATLSRPAAAPGGPGRSGQTAGRCGAATVSAALAARREAINSFLVAPPPPPSQEKVFSHNDFGAEHLLADPVTGEATGVIDFSDAAVTDPAADYGRLYRDFGAPALAVTPAAWRERAIFYARCMVFEDLAYGLGRHDPRYLDKSVAALKWLFG